MKIVRIVLYSAIYLVLVAILMNRTIVSSLSQAIGKVRMPGSLGLKVTSERLVALMSFIYVVIVIVLEQTSSVEGFTDIELEVLKDYTTSAKVTSDPQLKSILEKIQNAYLNGKEDHEKQVGGIIKPFVVYLFSKDVSSETRKYIIDAFNGNVADPVVGLSNIVKKYVTEEDKTDEAGQILNTILIDMIYKTRNESEQEQEQEQEEQEQKQDDVVQKQVEEEVKKEIENSGEAYTEGYSPYYSIEY